MSDNCIESALVDENELDHMIFDSFLSEPLLIGEEMNERQIADQHNSSSFEIVDIVSNSSSFGLNIQYNSDNPVVALTAFQDFVNDNNLQCLPLQKKVKLDSSNDIISVIQKHPVIAKFYNPVRVDYRHLYIRIMFETINAYEFDALKDLAYQVCERDCKYICMDSTSGSVNFSEFTNPDRLLSDWVSFIENYPDGLIYPYKYNLFKLCHIPLSFAGMPPECVDNVDYMNAYVSQLAKEQKIYPRPGYVIVGRDLFSGTLVHTSNMSSKYIKQHPVQRSLHFQEIFVYVLSESGKISRMESYISTPSSSLTNVMKYELTPTPPL